MDRIGIGIGIGIYGWVGYSDERWDRIARRSVIEKKQRKDGRKQAGHNRRMDGRMDGEQMR